MTTKPAYEYQPTHVVTGPVRWARVFKPDENGKFILDFEVTDKTTEDFFKSLGLEVKTDKKVKGRKFVPMQRYATNQDGTPKPFTLVDAKLEKFDKLIGNDSVCKVEFFVKDWTFQKRSGKYAYMTGVQVLKHIPYDPPARVGKFTEVDEYVETAEETNKFSKV